MTQEPQQPPHEPQPEPALPPVQPQAPSQQPPPPAQPQWGQYAPPQQPPAPAQPQWGQYAPQQPLGQHQGFNQQGFSQPGNNQPGYGNRQYVAPPKPGVIPLRPLGLGEVLDGAFQAARRNGKAMFGSALIFQFITAGLTLVVMLVGFGQFSAEIFGNEFLGTSSTQNDIDEALSTGLLLVGALSVVSILSALAQMVLQGALVIPVLRAVLNRKTGFSDMWRLVRGRIGSLILLALLYALAVFVATIIYASIIVGIYFLLSQGTSGSGTLPTVLLGLFLLLPFIAVGLWIGTKVLVAPAAIVVENIGVFAAIKRSWALTSRNWWRTFGITALAAIIASVIGGIISTPVSLFLSFLLPLMTPNPTPEQSISQAVIAQIISAFIGAMAGAITLAFQNGVMALLYVDLRMRRDGFDVILLKESENGKDDGLIPGRGTPTPTATGNYPPAPFPGQ